MSSIERDRVRDAARDEKGADLSPSASRDATAATTDGTLSFASPVGATLLVVYSWFATAAFFGPFSPMADDAGKLLLSALLVLSLSAVHELGHALTGRLVGLGFRSLTIGPLALVRQESGYRLRPNGHWIRFAGCVERDFSAGRPDHRRLMASALGGPGANLLLAAAFFATGAHRGMAADFALWSLLFGLINLVPIRSAGQTSDGGLVLALWRERRRQR